MILTPFNDDCGQMSKVVIWLKLVILLKIVLYTLKLHLHGRLLSARIDILPFFFLKSRRSLTRRKIHERFCLRGIATHTQKKSNRSSHSHGRDFNATLAYDCNSQKSLTSRIYTGNFFATEFEDSLCVKISLAERLLTRGETRLPRSCLPRIDDV